MLVNNHAGNTSCSGAARRAADAFAALPRLLQQHAAHAVLEATWSNSSRNIELLTEKSFLHRVFEGQSAPPVRIDHTRSGLDLHIESGDLFSKLDRAGEQLSEQAPYVLTSP